MGGGVDVLEGDEVENGDEGEERMEGVVVLFFWGDEYQCYSVVEVNCSEFDVVSKIFYLSENDVVEFVLYGGNVCEYVDVDDEVVEIELEFLFVEILMDLEDGCYDGEYLVGEWCLDYEFGVDNYSNSEFCIESWVVVILWCNSENGVDDEELEVDQWGEVVEYIICVYDVG